MVEQEEVAALNENPSEGVILQSPGCLKRHRRWTMSPVRAAQGGQRVENEED
jgi:hypothetical protein